ncbi:hypothetical protein C4D60_Mb10t22860 [Musa balbisiana]|uniref:Uncharacterized protein n=1 Tax=Musa balbisiana TaxID=52838 RepID=A0A4S8IZ53_MUSBA|nr:hypothetical protein C4D60_Mb10t22860 [Musa balbisiana]
MARQFSGSDGPLWHLRYTDVSGIPDQLQGAGTSVVQPATSVLNHVLRPARQGVRAKFSRQRATQAFHGHLARVISARRRVALFSSWIARGQGRNNLGERLQQPRCNLARGPTDKSYCSEAPASPFEHVPPGLRPRPEDYCDLQNQIEDLIRKVTLGAISRNPEKQLHILGYPSKDASSSKISPRKATCDKRVPARVAPDRFLTCASSAQLLLEPLQIGSRPVPRRPNFCPSRSRSVPDLCLVGPAFAQAAPDRFPTCASSAQLLPKPLQIGSRPLLPKPLQIGSRPVPRRPSFCPSRSRSVPDLCLASPAFAQAAPDRFPTYASLAQFLPGSLQIGSRPTPRWPSSCPGRSRSVPDLRLVGPVPARVAPDRFLTCASSAQLLLEPLQIGSRPVPRRPNFCPSRSRSVPDLCLASPAFARAAPDRFPTYASLAQFLPGSLQIGSRPTPRWPSSCPGRSRSVPDLCLVGPALARAAPDRFPTCASSAQLLPEPLQIGSRPVPRRPSFCPSRSRLISDLRLASPA